MPSHMQQASVEDVAQLKKEAEDRQKSSALRKADVLKEQKGFALDHAEGDTFFMS